MAPTTENKLLRKGVTIKLGLSPLKKWLDQVNSNGDPAFTIDNKDIDKDNKKYMFEMFDRIKYKIISGGTAEQLGPFHNCEAEANFIAKGKHETYQGDMIKNSLIIMILTEIGGKFIKESKV